MEAVQLTERDQEAIWKTKDSGMVLMCDMTETQLQGALVIVQKRQVKSVEMLQLDDKLETQLKKAAKNKGFDIQDLDNIKDTTVSHKYEYLKEVIKTASGSIKRKLKAVLY